MYIKSKFSDYLCYFPIILKREQQENFVFYPHRFPLLYEQTTSHVGKCCLTIWLNRLWHHLGYWFLRNNVFTEHVLKFQHKKPQIYELQNEGACDMLTAEACNFPPELQLSQALSSYQWDGVFFPQNTWTIFTESYSQ